MTETFIKAEMQLWLFTDSRTHCQDRVSKQSFSALALQQLLSLKKVPHMWTHSIEMNLSPCCLVQVVSSKLKVHDFPNQCTNAKWFFASTGYIIC
jgi:hypothetical protein